MLFHNLSPLLLEGGGIVYLCIYFYSVNQIKYNIILYNIQNRKTEKV